ncbi:hypothetical protein PFICI_09393 [Pestalotiopsis fici W106-1]|uniref:Uncharacterized protein n=1 Tax=Pestalotiopsis fici (strain W106-1 / CGMCC3.15140) TaxID=1229662 RepID=W3X0B0_PESFW|nr:uncharacterized protein PFICI_09393 [Pestalotiopsis fici W106-1]ETS79540.1 hypothetical protein PFICI_09393 [Pestalotiopsis fici W106-1]
MDDTKQPQQQAGQDVTLPMSIPKPRAQDFAPDLTSSPISTSPHTSVDDTLDPNITDLTDEMGQMYNSKSGLRGPPPPRPDLTDVLSIEQYKQLARLITIILEGMNKSLKELWEDMGVANKHKSAAEPRITGPTPMPAMFVSIPNPYSPKYAHLYGNKPLIPEIEAPKDGNAATSNDENKENKAGFNTPVPTSTTAIVDKKTKTKWPKPQVFLPPGMTTDDIKATNAGNKPKSSNSPTPPNLPVGIHADMLPLKLPKSFGDAVEMYGTKTEEEIMRSQITELKRDSLAHFGKFRANVAKRMDSVLIRKGGREGNVIQPQLSFESQAGHVGQVSGIRRGSGGGFPGSFKGRSQHGYPSAPSHVQGNNVSSTSTTEFDTISIRLFSPHSTPLSNQPKEKRACILHCVALILLGLDNYCSYSRALLCHLATSLSIPLHVLTDDENRIGKALAKIVDCITPEELQARRLEEGKNRFRRNHLKQLQPQDPSASVNASLNAPNIRPPNAVNGETVGGLAAPLVSAGLSTVFGGFGVGPAAATTMLQGMAESPVVVGTLFGLYGSRATAKMTESYAKDIQDFGLIPVHGQKDRTAMNDPFDVPADDRRLRLTIGVTGFFDPNIPDGDDCKNPWKCLGDLNEVYSLQWETEALLKTGAALDNVLKAPGWTEAKQDSTGNISESINTLKWPAAMIRCCKMIDNPWAVSMARAEKCGLVLADMILGNIGGHRPVTLIGYGAGARAIWVALMTLSEKRSFGLVENAVLMGCPSPSNTQSWAAARSIVTGRLVNVYSKKDIMMAFAMRLCNFTAGIAGLEEIVGVNGVQNYDVSNILTAHSRYRYLVGPILQRLGWEDVRAKQGQEQFAELDKMISEEKKRDELRAAFSRKMAASCVEQEQKAETAYTKTTTTVGISLGDTQQNDDKENVRPVNGRDETGRTPAGGSKSRKKRSGKGRKRG